MSFHEHDLPYASHAGRNPAASPLSHEPVNGSCARGYNPTPMDMSTGARARRRAKHEAMAREMFQEAKFRRQMVFLSVFVAAVVLVTIGAIGTAVGWW